MKSRAIPISPKSFPLSYDRSGYKVSRFTFLVRSLLNSIDTIHAFICYLCKSHYYNPHNMKTKLFISLPLICLLSSCAIAIRIPDMEERYNQRMTTPEELAAKSHVQIFLNEKDVPCDYTVIALVKYKPLTMPIFMPEISKMRNNFYKKSVIKAVELGGDAIIVEGMGFCKVISAPELRNDTATGQERTNGQMSSLVLEMFESGSFDSLSTKEKQKVAKSFQEEIEKDIEKCVTHENVAVVSHKIDLLEGYFVSVGQKTKRIEALRKDLNDVDAKITKKENRAKQRAQVKERFNDALNNLKAKK